MAISQSTKRRLQFGIPVFTGAVICMIMGVFEYAFTFFSLVGIYELTKMQGTFLRNMKQETKAGKEFIDFIENKFFYIQVVMMSINVIVPFEYSHSVTLANNGLTFLFSTILLMIYIKFHLKGRYKDEKINQELAQITFMKTAFDCLVLVWINTSNNCIVVWFNQPKYHYFYLLTLFKWVFLPETLALIAGKKWGKRNFSYFISPNKTIEGLWGQLAGAVICIPIDYLFRPIVNSPPISAFEIFLHGLIAIIVGIFGDLVESVFKRASGTKHSGKNLGSGLGGVLDKYDGLGSSAIALTLFYHLSPVVGGLKGL